MRAVIAVVVEVAAFLIDSSLFQRRSLANSIHSDSSFLCLFLLFWLKFRAASDAYSMHMERIIVRGASVRDILRVITIKCFGTNTFLPGSSFFCLSLLSSFLVRTLGLLKRAVIRPEYISRTGKSVSGRADVGTSCIERVFSERSPEAENRASVS
ncbi:hypothetical protein NA56DRAFT_126377 [Hyaloscypha hepaticicola]|uniref:Uncharacterized protein n=1 Tax=Hyaloscypha hepaticicola TaxID=2082293 RepID=A0A2J6Q546_9HELO|nr:hypothetical protein NA56DRAFT_126377 [Hyaloscypha hepaticicola]